MMFAPVWPDGHHPDMADDINSQLTIGLPSGRHADAERWLGWGPPSTNAGLSAFVFAPKRRRLVRDPEKWEPVFPRDKCENAFVAGSCLNNNLKRDGDSTLSHRALVPEKRDANCYRRPRRATAIPNRNAINSDPRGASRATLLRMLSGIPGFLAASIAFLIVRIASFTASDSSAVEDFGSMVGSRPS
jgi:hypothetical protein